MSIISEIRNRSWIMVLLVAFAIIAFLFDFPTLMNASFGGAKDKIGEVGSEEIRMAEYEEMKNLVSRQYANQGAVSANALDQLAWDELVNQKIIDQQVGKLDLRQTEEEFLSFAAQQFGFVTNDGSPDVNALKTNLASWQKNAATDPEAAQRLANWETNKSLVAKSLNQNKYIQLVSSGLLKNKTEMDFLINLQYDSATVNFVKIDYAKAFKGNKIEVKDEEIADYINKHAEKYTLKESRSIDYVYQKSNPSDKDVKATQEDITAFLNGKVFYDKNNQPTETLVPFVQSENDSVLVANYSDKTLPWTYFTLAEVKQVFSPAISDFATSAAVGQVSGVLRNTQADSDTFEIAKLNNKKAVTDSAMVSHVLITYIGSSIAANVAKEVKRSQAEAKVLADSLFAVVSKDPSAFGRILSLSDDTGIVADANGKLPWITRNMSGAPTLTDFALNNAVNKIGLVKTDLGFHIVRIDNTKSQMGYRLAVITKNIAPSEETGNNNYTKISDFYEKVMGKSRADFAKAANKNGLDFFTAEKATLFEANLNGLNTSKDADILRWAFNEDTKIGDIKKFETDDDGQIVVFLAEKIKAGLASVQSVKTEVTEILKKEKLAEQITKQNAKLSLEQIASKYSTVVQNSGVTFFNSSNIELQNESKVVGAAVGIKQNKKSEAISGKSALFYLQKVAVKKLDSFPKERISFVYNQFRGQAKREGMSKISASLKEFFAPKDERIKLLAFYTE